MERAKAIAHVKDMYEHMIFREDKEALETLIPELKESKDEKARKWLTNLVENLGDAADEDAEKELEVMRPLALAYLEKQKETIPCNVDEFTLTLRNCLFADSELMKEQADIFATTYGEELLNVAIGKIKSGLIKEDIADFKVKKQKDHFRDDTKMVEQKLEEWSEEDEDMLNSCISSIEEAKENRYAYKETDGDTSYDHEIAWLKSLHPSWKPSKEQMEALGRCVEYLEESDNEDTDILAVLYNQLKKLM